MSKRWYGLVALCSVFVVISACSKKPPVTDLRSDFETWMGIRKGFTTRTASTDGHYLRNLNRPPPVKVGYITDSTKPNVFTIDTTRKAADGDNYGNSNGGHEFGTDLSDDDKWRLLECLKSL
jgi:hypothetical protein